MAHENGRPPTEMPACQLAMQVVASCGINDMEQAEQQIEHEAMCSWVTTAKDRKGPKDTRRRVTLTHQDPASLPWLPCSAGTSAVRTL
jgi:hypothetical protein